MARRKSQTLTEVELEFMQVVWDAGEVTTEGVMETLRRQGRPLADGSVRKILSILRRKGYLKRRREGRGFVYWAAVPRERASRRMVTDLLKRAFDGSAAQMVAALMDGREVSDDELRQIKHLIDKHERGG